MRQSAPRNLPYIIASLFSMCLTMFITQSELIAQLTTESPVILNRDQPLYLVERNFRQALAQPISASWSNVGIRTVLERIEKTQQISLILDRRIDPSTTLKIDLQNQSVEAGLDEIASALHGRAIVVGSNIYLGPDQAMGTFKTLLAQKQQELLALSDNESGMKTRATQLSRNKSFYYQDLDTPVQLLNQIADSYQITISNPERIPHDLWSHGALMAVNANEALLLVLNQLNLTFLWEKQGTAIRLLPVPDHVTVQKTYSPRGHSLSETIEHLKKLFPAAMITRKGRMLLVDASADLQEKVEAELNPAKRPVRKMGTPQIDVLPIQRRKFTLRAQKVPVLAVMQKLEQSGIEFEYQPQQLKQAGVDLTQRIDISVQNADANEFFDVLFGPLNLSYQIEGIKVSLTPDN